MSMQTLKRGSYLWLVLAGLVSLTLALLLTNRYIDPFNMQSKPRIEGLNQMKPEGLRIMRLSKPAQLRSVQPEILILGTSRAGEGIPCQLVADESESCFNASLPGGTLAEMLALLQHAHAISPVKEVIIGLDFAPTYQDQRYITPFESSRLAQGENSKLQLAKDYLHLFASNTALGASLRTWQAQDFSLMGKKPGVGNIENDGSWYWAYQEEMPNEELSRRMRREYGFVYEHFLHRFEQAKVSPGAQTVRLQSHLADYEAMLRFCASKGISLKSFIGPYHLVFMSAVVDAGLQREWAEWKQQVQLSHSKLTSELGIQNNPLLDFSGPDARSRQPIPRPGLALEPMWFLDAAHYTRRYGAQIVAQLEAASAGDSTSRMVSIDIGQAVEELVGEVNEYRRLNPADRNQMQRIYTRFSG